MGLLLCVQGQRAEALLDWLPCTMGFGKEVPQEPDVARPAQLFFSLTYCWPQGMYFCLVSIALPALI